MKFIVTYWTQITFMLLALGYFTKEIITHIIKLKEIRFNTFHVDRANVIKETYRELIMLKRLLRSLNFLHFAAHKESIVKSDLAITKEEWELFTEKLNEQNILIKNTFDINRILFSKKFAAKMDLLYDTINKEFIETSRIVTPTNSERFEEYYRNDFEKLLTTLETEFRKYL
jgi:hypothetical protein